MRSSAAVSGSAISAPTCETSSCQRSIVRRRRSGRSRDVLRARMPVDMTDSCSNRKGAADRTAAGSRRRRARPVAMRRRDQRRVVAQRASVGAGLRGARRRRAGWRGRAVTKVGECDNLFTASARASHDRLPTLRSRRRGAARRSPRRRGRTRAARRRCRRPAAAAPGGSGPACAESFIGLATRRTVPASGCGISTRHPARLHLRVGEHLGEVVDRPARHLGRLERREPVGARPRLQPRGQQRHERRRGGARGRRCARSAGRARARAQPATAQKRANWPSLPTARIRWPSATSNTWYGTMFWCALPARCGADAGGQVVGAEVGEHRHLGVEQRHVDRLALAGARRGGAAPRGSRSWRTCR